MTSTTIPQAAGEPPAGTATIQGIAPNAGATWQPIEGPETRELLANVFRGESESSARRSVSEASADILARCADPHGHPITETGLVVGHVQSGKTLSFTTVAALARDNSFHLVIIMTGISISLFDQSTRRLRRDLRLDTSRDRQWNMFSNPTSNGDFRALQDLLLDWLDATTPHDQKMTALITVMKNHRHLANLRDLLQRLDLRRSPVLIIDDEADQASMNTKVRQDDESTTYQRIGEIRQACIHHTFLQYTATPQAPLLISLIDTLSPNFVHILEPGAGYVGGRDFFIEFRNSHVLEIPDNELAVDPEEAEAPPDSLLQALRVFIIGVAASYATSQANPSGNRSMLVHPSHRTTRHTVYTGWITRVKTQWEAILGRPTAAAAELLEEFRSAYEDIQRTEPTTPSFKEVCLILPRAIRLTRVMEVNARPGKTPMIEWSNAYSWILVAGQAVDRGFTVEGLTVTYMPRGVGVGNADTLQQRGRFFGYKRPYLGYCRLYLPSDVIDAFHDYIEHEEDVRTQLREYQQPGRSLNEWKRAFIMSPSLRPTRHQVLRLEYSRGLLSNDWLAPRYPLAADAVLEINRRIARSFLQQLEMLPDNGHPDRTAVQRHLLAQDVRLEAVLQDLLIPLKVPASTDAQKFTGLMLQLRRALEQDPNELCSVYRMSPDEKRRRGLNQGQIPNLFQGAYPVEPRSQRGSIYPGDRELHAANRVTVQIHLLSLTDGSDGPVITTEVPIVAVWVPSRLAAPWVVQDDEA